METISLYFLLGRYVIVRNDRIIGVIDMGSFGLNKDEYDYIKPISESELYKHNYEKSFYFMIKQRIGELGIDV